MKTQVSTISLSALVILLIIGSVLSISDQERAREVEGLTAFYDATNGENWYYSDWLQNDDHCNWFGITCNAEGYVNTIELANNELTGWLPLQLSYLTQLRELSLPFNGIQGWIPDELTDNGYMEILNLNSNIMYGTIPSRIANWPNLKVLELGNSISGEIPESIGTLTNLKVISLIGNLHGQIPSSIEQLEQLQVLIISENELTGLVPAGINRLTNLVVLDFSQNKLSGFQDAPTINPGRCTFKGNPFDDCASSAVNNWEFVSGFWSSSCINPCPNPVVTGPCDNTDCKLVFEGQDYTTHTPEMILSERDHPQSSEGPMNVSPESAKLGLKNKLVLPGDGYLKTCNSHGLPSFEIYDTQSGKWKSRSTSWSSFSSQHLFKAAYPYYGGVSAGHSTIQSPPGSHDMTLLKHYADESGILYIREFCDNFQIGSSTVREPACVCMGVQLTRSAQ